MWCYRVRRSSIISQALAIVWILVMLESAESYSSRTIHRSYSSHRSVGGRQIFYVPARKLRGRPTNKNHIPTTYGTEGESTRSVKTKSGSTEEPYLITRVTDPIIVEKQLTNENGVLTYRTVNEFPTRETGGKARRQKTNFYKPQTTISSRRRTTTSGSRGRRKMNSRHRQRKKYRPTRRFGGRPTTRSKTRTKVTTTRNYKRRNKNIGTTSTNKHGRTTTKGKKSKIDRTGTRPASPKSTQTSGKLVSKGQIYDFDIKPTIPRQPKPTIDVSRLSTLMPTAPEPGEGGESANEIGLRKLYAAATNKYGLMPPRGFRFTTRVSPEDKRKDKIDIRSSEKPSPRVMQSDTPHIKNKYNPTNPSVPVLKIHTTSIDDAHAVLRGLGTGFRVRLVPTSSIMEDDDSDDVKPDEFDIGRPSVANTTEDKSRYTGDAVATLRALFKKLSNVTGFQSMRILIGEKNKVLSDDRSSQSNRSWWERENVCSSESPGLFGLSPTVFYRLTPKTHCTESKEQYRCVERYGPERNSPRKTTIYRCCPGYKKSLEGNKCKAVKRLSDFDVEEKKARLLADTGAPEEKELMVELDIVTIFMPSENVVDEYLTEHGFDSDKDHLRLFFENHVVMGSAAHSKELENNQILMAMSENPIRINYFNDGSLMTVNCRKVLKRDEVFNQSMIHVIDDVLQDVKQSIYEYVSKHHDQFSMFKSVIDGAGLAPIMQATDQTITLLAPTNDAFEFSKDIPESPRCLIDLVKNHVLNSVQCSSSWNISTETSELVSSQSGYSIHLSKIEDQIFANDARIISLDIMTGNGVLHAVDRVLISDKARSVLSLLKNDRNSQEMLRLLEKGLMKDVLSSGDNFTLLVPENSAFKKLSSSFIDTLKRNPDELRRFLLFHMIPYEISESELSSRNSLGTLDPSYDVKITSYKIRVRPRWKNHTRITKQSAVALQCGRVITTKKMKACNGMVLHIHKVLEPPTSSVMAALERAPRGNFSILLRAISRAKLGQILSNLKDITLFAPTNTAFERMPGRFVRFMFQNVRILQRIMRFHISKGYHCCDYLLQGYFKLPTQQGGIIASCAKKKSVLLGRSKNRLRAKIVRCELPAKNGIIHAIDNILLPPGLRN